MAMNWTYALATLACASATASAKPAPEPATLEIEMAAQADVRVFIGKKELKTRVLPGGSREATLPGSGLQRLRIQYRREDGTTYVHDALVAVGPGVKVRAMEIWGHKIVARPEGKRCGAVSGHRGDWYLCDGYDVLPRDTAFRLECAAPAAMASEHYFVIEPHDPDSIVSASFLPTLPGLYRARYANGKISIRYEPDDCAGL